MIPALSLCMKFPINLGARPGYICPRKEWICEVFDEKDAEVATPRMLCESRWDEGNLSKIYSWKWRVTNRSVLIDWLWQEWQTVILFINTGFGSRLFAKSEGARKWQTAIFMIKEDKSSRREFCLTTDRRLFLRSEWRKKWQTATFMIKEDENSGRKFCLTIGVARRLFSKDGGSSRGSFSRFYDVADSGTRRPLNDETRNWNNTSESAATFSIAYPISIFCRIGMYVFCWPTDFVIVRN